jgi:hypothetical protein
MTAEGDDMQDGIDPKRLTRSGRAGLLVVAALLSGVAMAGCGGSSSSPAAATVRLATTPASATPSSGSATTAGSSIAARSGTTGSGSTAPVTYGSGPLAFAKCMRANGVPSFPDPNPGRGALFSLNGINPSAPAFKQAQAKCQKLMGGGPPGPGSTTHPSAQTMGKLRKIAVCMRQHGVPQFPDPRTTVPSNPAAAGIQEITDFDGAILLFPSTINLQAPAYRPALAACGAPPLGLPH